MYGMVSGHAPSNTDRRRGAGNKSRSQTRYHRPKGLVTESLQSSDDEQTVGKPKVPLARRLWTCLRETWTGVKHSLDSELEEENPVYRRPSDRLKDLASRTNFSRAELKALYRGFKADCPSGILRAEAFKNFYAQLFPKGAIASQYANYVFDAMDAQRTGLLGFEDLIMTLSDLTRGNEERKWRWVFALYDVDGDGVLSRADVEEVATSIYELTGVGMANSTSNIPLTLDADTSEAIQRSVEAFFEKMDRNRDGVITLDEFLKVCTDDALTRQSLDAFQHLV